MTSLRNHPPRDELKDTPLVKTATEQSTQIVSRPIRRTMSMSHLKHDLDVIIGFS